METQVKRSQALLTVPNLRNPLDIHSAAGLPLSQLPNAAPNPIDPTMSNVLYPSCNAAGAPQNSKEEARRRYIPRRRIDTKSEFPRRLPARPHRSLLPQNSLASEGPCIVDGDQEPPVLIAAPLLDARTPFLLPCPLPTSLSEESP